MIEVQSGAEVQNKNGNGNGTATQIETVRPIGNVEFIKWYQRQLVAEDGTPTPKTISELVAAYPTPIKQSSFQAKLSKVRKWAASKNLKLAETKRAGRTGAANEVDIDALAAELNLSRLVDEDE